MRPEIDAGDIQAIAKTAFGSLKSARYALLRVGDPTAARRWLYTLAPTSIALLKESPTEICQIAFTATGLQRLGVNSETLQKFSPEFVEGMASNENRSRRLGDVGENDPKNWSWGIGEKEPHILLILFATEAQIETFVTRVLQDAAEAGLSEIGILSDSDMNKVEPFGFTDGISQPSFDWDHPRTPGTKADQDYTNLLALGELLLGYRNEYGLLMDRPLLDVKDKNADLLRRAPSGIYDLGLNGSYLVYRQLAQDVRGFWQWVCGEANRCGITKEELAEAMIGRKLDGSPLADLGVGRSIPGVRRTDRNGFLFDTDPYGLSCPIGAHIRRANPRTGDLPGGRVGPLDSFVTMLGLTTRRDRRPTASTLPWPKNMTVWPYFRFEDDSVASARFHRILRRGREYGIKLDRNSALSPASGKDPEAGIHFLCLNASIARQFEFVQGAWIASSKFSALTGEQDPLLGNRQPFPTTPIAAPQRTDGFSRPNAAPQFRHAINLPPFVRVRGGAYFFLPSLAALRWIATN